MKDLVPHTSLIGHVYENIVYSLLELRSFFNHVYCEADYAGYNLARYTLSSNLDVTWVRSPLPSFNSEFHLKKKINYRINT